MLTFAYISNPLCRILALTEAQLIQLLATPVK